jgi:hypothetical protein
MRRPRMRFTVRRMMVVVAAFGVVLGGWLEVSRLARVSTARRRDAASYAASEALARKFARQSSRFAQELLGVARSSRPSAVQSDFSQRLELEASIAEESAARSQRNADHWAMMKKKYERAARFPWSSVGPDPPPPID